MRFNKTILTLLLIFTCSKVFSIGENITSDTTKHTLKVHHKKHLNWPHPKYALPDSMKYYDDCVLTEKYSEVQLLQQYPFNKATKILAVSYQNGGEPNPDFRLYGKVLKPTYKPYGLYVKNGKLNPKSLFELKQFSKAQTVQLGNLLYNTTVKAHYDTSKYAEPGSGCFFPRNAILFIDKNEKVFDYIEICYQCGGTDSKSHKLFLFRCNQALDISKKLLTDIGIKFGTTTTNDALFQHLTVKYPSK